MRACISGATPMPPSRTENRAAGVVAQGSWLSYGEPKNIRSGTVTSRLTS